MKIFLNSPREDFEKLELQKPTGYFNSFIIIPTGELHDSNPGDAILGKLDFAALCMHRLCAVV